MCVLIVCCCLLLFDFVFSFVLCIDVCDLVMWVDCVFFFFYVWFVFYFVL